MRTTGPGRGAHHRGVKGAIARLRDFRRPRVHEAFIGIATLGGHHARPGLSWRELRLIVHTPDRDAPGIHNEHPL
ncbi:hypothetical protein [Actinacidiphila glaucinigra]|uniref:hypothetical protein n=1 Tax=Actinacidiphila glaucinigra TaxID=235986 RepID=UPI00366B7EB0